MNGNSKHIDDVNERDYTYIGHKNLLFIFYFIYFYCLNIAKNAAIIESVVD